jgi:predicted NAD/FAD-binding protein
VTRRRIAVIGGGVSGITAGYVLSQTDDVTLFEAGARLGGHADTHLVVPPAGPPVGVDTGFIVYNERTYPLLTRLFAELGVTTQPAPMSMSVRCAGCGLQYAGQRGAAGLVAGLPCGRGRYLRMLTEVRRFHRAAREDYGAHYAETLRLWRERFGAQPRDVARLGFDQVFRRMWNFYLCYAEAGFRASYIGVSQLTLARAAR